jgi:hypothetical protein
MWFRYTSSYLKMLFLLLAGAAFFLGGSLSQAGGPKIAAADWHLNDVDGKLLKLPISKVRSSFWISGPSWCAPCRADIPGFVALERTRRNSRIFRNRRISRAGEGCAAIWNKQASFLHLTAPPTQSSGRDAPMIRQPVVAKPESSWILRALLGHLTHPTL